MTFREFVVIAKRTRPALNSKAGDLPRDGAAPIEKRVSEPDKAVLFATQPQLSVIEQRLQALEEENARLKAALEGRTQGEPPPALASLRHEGESLADFHQRMRKWRFDLHAKMLGAREGVGEFSAEDRHWLKYLEREDWLGN